MEIPHQLHQVRLLYCGINQWLPVISWLEDRGEELVIILSPVGQDEVAPRVFFELFRVVIGKLQCGIANAVAQVHPCWVVAGVKVVKHCIPHIAGQVDQAVRWVCGDGHGAPEVADKEAKVHLSLGLPPALRVSHTAWRSTSMSLMKSRIWSRVYKQGSILWTTSPT